TGVDLFDHIRHMLWTTVPGFALALLIFLLIGGGAAATPEEIALLQQSLTQEFTIGLHLLLPLLLMLVLIYRRFPAFPSIVVSSLVGAVFAILFQPDTVRQLAENDPSLAQPLLLLKGVWISLFDGYISDSG